jgi:hypothetical protein
MTQVFLDANELDSAARAAVAEAGQKGAGPVAVVVAEVDARGARPGGGGGGDGESAWSPEHAEALNGAVTEMIGSSLRGGDLVGRVGDRVVMILANASADDGRAVGDRLCAAVRTHRFANGFGARTLSGGAAAAPDHGQSYEIVLEAALSYDWP